MGLRSCYLVQIFRLAVPFVLTWTNLGSRVAVSKAILLPRTLGNFQLLVFGCMLESPLETGNVSSSYCVDPPSFHVEDLC